MRNIKLLEPWGPYVKGNWAAVEDKVAENLIAKGIAIDPTRPKPEPVVTLPSPMTAKAKAVPKKAAKKKKANHPVRRKLS